MKLCFPLLLLLTSSSYAFGQGKGVYMHCPSIYFGNYQPGEPQSLNDLPDIIRVKLEAHLIRRLGLEFYSKLKFAGGQIVDLKELYIVEKSAKDYRWKLYSYYLCFSFQDIAKGIERYIGNIVLDKYGDIVEEIELPDMQRNPQKANIISLQQAKAIAIKNECYDDRHTSITFEYSKMRGSLIWRFERHIFEKSMYQFEEFIPSKMLEIDAHSGEIIDSITKMTDPNKSFMLESGR